MEWIYLHLSHKYIPQINQILFLMIVTILSAFSQAFLCCHFQSFELFEYETNRASIYKDPKIFQAYSSFERLQK